MDEHRPAPTRQLEVTRLLTDLARRGIELEARGDRLRFRPKMAMSPGLIDRLKAHKPAILAALRGGWLPPTRPDGAADDSVAPSSPAVEVPHELSLDERIQAGYVNPGWTRRAWANRLVYLAERCQAARPELAAQYRTWAAKVRAKG